MPMPILGAGLSSPSHKTSWRFLLDKGQDNPHNFFFSPDLDWTIIDSKKMELLAPQRVFKHLAVLLATPRPSKKVRIVKFVTSKTQNFKFH